jgi:DNA-binding transcriptional ArsR family regulator
MKYGQLINFDPIETVIQIKDADDSAKAARLVETYVMSDDMADMINEKILSQLSLDEVIDNKGVFLVGNYGTGKSHLMSVISAIAQDENHLKYARNKKFAEYMRPIAGRFEVLRIEIGAVKTSLRDIVTTELEKDLANRGIHYTFPPADTITSNKQAFNEMMERFEAVFGPKGYLLVIDELLDYLKSRTEMELMHDLAFIRELGELIKNTRFRVICGVQESLFESPSFSFAASTLLKAKDRYEQAIIRREDIAYVVSERILKKTSKQKAWIREHLQKFCNLYKNMAERLEEFVELFPIHPAYIETFERVYLAEKREILKTISATVKEVLVQDVPEDQPGIKSYDSYWKYIKENMAKKAEPEIKEVLDKSGVLEDIISRSFISRPIYKPMAIRIIYGLSVHRLTTGGLDVRAGLTAQNLKDDLCLYIDMPEKDEEFLLSTVQSVMKAIMETVSGQFIEYNKDNEQYFLDLKKDIDYDAKIEQRANTLHDSHFNRYFYTIIYDMLDWQVTEYVSGHRIYEYFINWEGKNIFRSGYLFMGESNERPTAQPPRDFYVYFLPPYGELTAVDEKKDDEVFFKFRGDDEFEEHLRLFAGAKEMEQLSGHADSKKVYSRKAEEHKRDALRWLNNHKLSCFTATYKGVNRQIFEVLHGRRINDMTFKEIIDTTASVLLSDYFAARYSLYPKFKVKITNENYRQMIQRGLDYIAGKKTQDGANLLDSFGLLERDRINPERSMYASYFIKKMNSLPSGAVLNASDIFENPYEDVFYDREFKLNREWIVLILAALIYSGHVIVVAGNNVHYDASNLEEMASANFSDLYNFRHVGKPRTPALAELKKLFNILALPEGLIINPSTWEEAVSRLLERIKHILDKALATKELLNENFALWGEFLIPDNIMKDYINKIDLLKNFGNSIISRFNTPAKLRNFDYTVQQLEEVADGIETIEIVEKYKAFKDNCSANVEYFSKVELILDDEKWLEKIRREKQEFLKIRDLIKDLPDDLAFEFNNRLSKLKEDYITYYVELHNRCRLDLSGSKRKGELMQSRMLANLKKLSKIEGILDTGKLDKLIDDELASLKVCYELSSIELKQNHICMHCFFKPADKERPVIGMLEAIEEGLEQLEEEWTRIILDSIKDPLVVKDIQYLEISQRRMIEEFLSKRKLPDVVDDSFVEAVNILLKGLDKVEVSISDLAEVMASWGPCTVDDMTKRFDNLVKEWSKGRDKNKLRIIIKK